MKSKFKKEVKVNNIIEMKDYITKKGYSIYPIEINGQIVGYGHGSTPELAKANAEIAIDLFNVCDGNYFRLNTLLAGAYDMISSDVKECEIVEIGNEKYMLDNENQCIRNAHTADIIYKSPLSITLPKEELIKLFVNK